jgi:hypothetical protein
MTSAARLRLGAVLLAAAACAACIDVGHSAEVGCLVDMNEPGCPGAMLADAGGPAVAAALADAAGLADAAEPADASTLADAGGPDGGDADVSDGAPGDALSSTADQ